MAETLKAPGQPFTFPGVARYASARLARLVTGALLFALVTAAVIAQFARTCWWPVVGEAVGALPESARIERGALQVTEKESRLLGANQFLLIQLALGDAGNENGSVDFAVSLGRFELTVTSLLGETSVPYPDRWTISLERGVLWPFWGAWRTPLLAALAGAVLVGLPILWGALGLLYAPFVLLASAVAGRHLRFGGAWKLAIVAQWPGSLLMSFAIALYSTGQIALLFVLVIFLAHFIPTLIYILSAPFFLPEVAKAEKSNPFRSEERKSRSRKNPFGAESSGE